MISLTEAAEKHLKKQLSKSKQALAYVFFAKRSGCSGLSYVLDLVEKELGAEQYESIEVSGLPFYIERRSIPYFKGLTIDLRQEGLQSHLIYINPNAVGACGCGESFAVDED